ncbi:myrosinase 1 isoform X2 [Nilaparvata lugens]|nr:myrosinase 1 isoform X2 [Nilaparvata lugens]
MSGMDFPKDFLIGAASASYQIEGAWNEDGKGENIWDYYTHKYPNVVRDRSNGDVACDSYHKYKEDVQLLKAVGFSAYRFSISWSRILPKGDDSVINEEGVKYYSNLIDELLANGIKPLVTMYHWDLPEPLDKIGGWTNPVLADFFEAYARILFIKFGKKVKLWLTLNEPFEVVHGYGSADYAPFVNYHGVAEYLAAHTLIRAHAKAYHLYDKLFRNEQQGLIGITLNSEYFFPKTTSADDVEAAETAMQFFLGWFAHPIYSKEGDYPSVMRQRVDENSKKEGRFKSRLPSFTQEEIESIRGSSDFFGLNHYTSRYASKGQFGKVPSVEYDSGIVKTIDPAWPGSASEWLKVVPSGFRNLVNWIKREYGDKPIIVTENGFSDKGELIDDDRINYYSSYLKELSKSIKEDKCNVIGYFAWSIMDNFEWCKGYTERFGIYQVDFTSPDRKRTPKKSVKFFQKLVETRIIPEDVNTL